MIGERACFICIAHVILYTKCFDLHKVASLSIGYHTITTSSSESRASGTCAFLFIARLQTNRKLLSKPIKWCVRYFNAGKVKHLDWQRFRDMMCGWEASNNLLSPSQHTHRRTPNTHIIIPICRLGRIDRVCLQKADNTWIQRFKCDSGAHKVEVMYTQRKKPATV